MDRVMCKFFIRLFVIIVTLVFCPMTFADESRSNLEAEYKASCVGKLEEGLIQKFGFPERVHEVGQTKFLMYKWFNSHPSNFCSAMFTSVNGKITNVNVAEFKNPLQKHGACAYAVINWYSTRVGLTCD